jgi:hypothetical protein
MTLDWTGHIQAKILGAKLARVMAHDCNRFSLTQRWCNGQTSHYAGARKGLVQNMLNMWDRIYHSQNEQVRLKILEHTACQSFFLTTNIYMGSPTPHSPSPSSSLLPLGLLPAYAGKTSTLLWIVRAQAPARSTGNIVFAIYPIISDNSIEQSRRDNGRLTYSSRDAAGATQMLPSDPMQGTTSFGVLQARYGFGVWVHPNPGDTTLSINVPL